MTSREPILEIKDLTVEFTTEDGVVHAVTNVSYDLYPGEVLGIVGESGSGKSVSMLSVLGLIPMPPGRILTGEAIYKGKDLLKLPKDQLREIRGGEMAMIFQDPMTSLNPVFTIGDQISEALLTHNSGMSDGAANKRTIELLELVGVPFAERRVEQYPHEFSGGMRQRAMIAMAIANDPTILIADEPTTALDVTIQAQIVEVLKTAQAETHAATILITHDLGLDRGACRPRGRHVRGPGRRARRRLHDLRLPPPSLHGRPHEQPCQGRCGPGPPRADSRPATEPDHAAAGMCVSPSLCAVSRPRDLQDRHPASFARPRKAVISPRATLPRSSHSVTRMSVPDRRAADDRDRGPDGFGACADGGERR